MLTTLCEVSQAIEGCLNVTSSIMKGCHTMGSHAQESMNNGIPIFAYLPNGFNALFDPVYAYIVKSAGCCEQGTK